MALRLERFSVMNAPRRGVQLHHQVQREHHGLEEAFPKTVERYRDPAHAVYNYVRLARRRRVLALLAVDDASNLPQGVATLMPHQRIEATNNSDVHFSGTDIDYWLGGDASPEDHLLLGATLIKIAGEKWTYPVRSHETAVGNDPLLSIEERLTISTTNRVMTTARVGAAMVPLGLMQAEGMESLGPPSTFMTPDDPSLELAKDGAQLQLYAGVFPVSE